MSNQGVICKCGHALLDHGQNGCMHVENHVFCDCGTFKSNELQPPATPMCEKWGAVLEQYRNIEDFLEFAQGKGWFLEGGKGGNRQALLYAFFEIDAVQLERERRALLDHQRKINEQQRR